MTLKNNKVLAKALRRYKIIEFFIDWIYNKKDICLAKREDGELLDIDYFIGINQKELICEFLDIDYEEIKKVGKEMRKIEEQLAKLSNPGE